MYRVITLIKRYYRISIPFKCAGIAVAGERGILYF